MADQVFVTLSPDEVRQRAEKLAGVLVALDELAEERKESTQDFNDRKKDLSKEARRLAAVIRHKGEYQDAQAQLLSLPPQEGGGRRSKRTDS